MTVNISCPDRVLGAALALALVAGPLTPTQMDQALAAILSVLT